MTRDEAEQLAKRIINTWRGGPPLADWVQILEPLEHGYAGTTYVRLRAQDENPPTIARFLATYRGVRGPTDTAPRRETGEFITRDEYLTRLSRRAANGSTEAQSELDCWIRFGAWK